MSVHVKEREGTVSSRHAMDAALLRGAVMLTPHVRLAQVESAVFDAARHADGGRLWQPATILPWRAWTGALWRDALVAGVESRVLLNALQERVLWEQAVRAGGADTLQSLPLLAGLCAGAAALLGGYDLQGDFQRVSYGRDAGSPNESSFARWWITFEGLCTDGGFLPAAHAEVALAEHIRRGRIAPAAEYLLHGFDALTPAQALLLQALRGAGADVRYTLLPRRPTTAPTLAACASTEVELAQCAAWARRALEQDGARIAIVVPDLQDCRPVLERALRAVVAPELCDVTVAGDTAPYEFSTGRALGTLPLVADALTLLRWCAGEVPVDDAGAVLRSCFFTLGATLERCAELDAFVLRDRQALRGLVPMERVAGWVERTDPATATALRMLVGAARNLDRKRGNHATFADGVRSLLRAAGWPGVTITTGDEHQVIDRWEETLDKMASLDALGLRVTFGEFLKRLTEAARDVVFAPDNTNTPLQVTTVTEALGRETDALWFLHADERTWPVRPRLHSLLPMALQRALRMPGTDGVEDERAAQRQLDALLCSAGHATFSYACTAGEAAQQVSPLVLALDGLTAMPVVEATEQDGAPLLDVMDDVAPLPPLPAGVVAGGVSVLAAQALCGFRAFAEKRLFSRTTEASVAGLTAGERGEQVHRVLEAFWRAAKDQATLKAMRATRNTDGVSERDRLLRRCIDTELTNRPAETWERAYLEVQRQRIFDLLASWLDFESTRPSFSVEALEQTVPDAAVGPLRLELRLDRIDRVGSGGEGATFLIDYKTGSTLYTKADWMGERPSEPQLPVYALAGDIAHVQGVAFGAVKVGKRGHRFEVAAADPKLLGSRAGSVDFDLQVQTWAADLTQLAADFAAGEAAVDPKEYPKTCDFCGQRMLCRLDASALLNIDDMDEDDEDGLPW